MMRHLVGDARTGTSARRCGLWRPKRHPKIFGDPELVATRRMVTLRDGVPDRRQQVR